MPILDHFGLIAPFYDRFSSILPPEKIMALAGLPADGAADGCVLDVGGGTGRVSQGLVGRAGQVVVVDVSTRMLAQAKKKPGLETAAGESEALPFPSGCFDAVIMVDAFHHVADQSQTVRELYRVLRPGGRLVIEEPDIRTLAVKLVAFGEKALLMRSHFVSPPRIAAMFKELGGKVRIEWEGVSAWVVIEKN